MPLAIDYGFLAISHYARIHRWKHVKHAPIEHARIEHARIEHAPDLRVYGVTHFAFVDHRSGLGCDQSLAACSASEGWYGITRPPAW
jgi:hypothetical protein